MMRLRSVRMLIMLAVCGVDHLSLGAQPNDLDSPFVVVFIDSKSEHVFGQFPYDRSVYAQGIDRAAALGAKGVILKFFIDKPRTSEGDNRLVRAAMATKLIVQARLDDLEPTPNPLPDRFRLPMTIEKAGNPLSGKSGWLPLPALSAAAYDVGFIDNRVIDRMPIIERYGDRFVKSLFLCGVELAYGEHAEIVPGKTVRLHGKTVALDDRSEIGIEYPKTNGLPFISFCDFVGPIPHPEVKNKVVILAYDSERFAAIDTPLGKVRPHRAFVFALMSIYGRFK